VLQPVREQRLDPFLPNPVLHHPHRLDPLVRSEGFRPGNHGTVLQPITAANDGFQRRVGCFRFRFLDLELRDGVRDGGARGGAEAVVVQDQVLEREMRGEEGDEWRFGQETEGVVREVDRGEAGEVKEGGEEVGEGGRDFFLEAAGVDVCEVGVLWRTGRG